MEVMGLKREEYEIKNIEVQKKFDFLVNSIYINNITLYPQGFSLNIKPQGLKERNMIFVYKDEYPSYKIGKRYSLFYILRLRITLSLYFHLKRDEMEQIKKNIPDDKEYIIKNIRERGWSEWWNDKHHKKWMELMQKIEENKNIEINKQKPGEPEGDNQGQGRKEGEEEEKTW